MSKPSSREGIYDWWKAALKGQVSARALGLKPGTLAITDEPHAGHYRRRLVRGGPWVAAIIWLHSEVDEDGELVADERLRCRVNGRECDPYEEWLYLAAQPISLAEFKFLSADAAWAKVHAPWDARANPEKKIDFMTASLPSFKRRKK